MDDPAEVSSPRYPKRKREAPAPNYSCDRSEVAHLHYVPRMYISEHLSQKEIREALPSVTTYVATCGVCGTLGHKPYRHQQDFIFQDGPMAGESECVVLQAMEWCLGHLKQGKSVLVHCAAGVNRSSLVFCLVVQRLNPSMQMQNIIQDLREAKAAVNPSWLTFTNHHFEDYLLKDPSDLKRRRGISIVEVHPHLGTLQIVLMFVVVVHRHRSRSLHLVAGCSHAGHAGRCCLTDCAAGTKSAGSWVWSRLKGSMHRRRAHNRRLDDGSSPERG